MDGSGKLELKSLGMDELVGVINLYPWFGGARKELFSRLLAMGGGEATNEAYAEASMYVVSRKAMVKLLRDRDRRAYEDKDVPVGRKVYVVGGDFFSQDQYDRVKSEEDKAFSGLKFREDAPVGPVEDRGGDAVEIYTETLAQIYAEQGYYEQAKQIYSKLILADPKKNAYFAALIEKLGQN